MRVLLALLLSLAPLVSTQDGGEIPDGTPRSSVGRAVPAAIGTAGHRRYWRLRIADLATNVHTHVCIVGRLALRVPEADGDIHLRLEDGRAFVIAEIIPELPVRTPALGSRIEACGIARYDRAHRWNELHPVLALRALRGETRGTSGGDVAPIAFIHPRSTTVLSGSPYGTDIPVQTHIPRDARNRVWLLAWDGDNCAGTSARQLDGDQAPTLQPETLGQKLYQVHVGEGECRFVAETHDADGRTVSRGALEVHIK